MNRIVSSLFVTGILLGGVTFIGCDSTANDSPPRVRILMTDAPRAEMISALVSIVRVEIKGPDSLSTILTDSVQEFDLLTLQNDSTIVLVDTILTDGIYSQLRLIVGENAVVEFDDGSTQHLKIPSGSQSGIKFLLHDVGLFGSQDTLNLVLDFDVNESFIEAGQSGQLLFKPVIKIKSADKSGRELGLN